MGLFNLKTNKFKKVKQSYWKNKSKVPLPWQRNDDDKIGDDNDTMADNKKLSKEEMKEVMGNIQKGFDEDYASKKAALVKKYSKRL